MSIRAYINPYPPRFGEAWQRARISPDAAVYVQTKGGNERERAIKSIRKGDIFEVAPLFLLARLRGGTKRRTAELLAEANKVLDAGATIREGKDGRTSKSRKDWAAMIIEAREAIGSSARGIATGAKNGQLSKGRPRKAYTEQTLRIIDRYWPPRKGWSVDRSVEAINELSTQIVKRGWLYTNRPVRAESK